MNAELMRKVLARAYPVMLGYLAIGIPAGILEAEIGLSPVACFVISATFYTGAGQFMIPGMVMAGSALPSIIASVSFVNTRQLLYATAFSPYFARAGRALTFLFSASVTDESFGVNLELFQTDDEWTPVHALALNIACMLSWAAANALGALVGSLLALPVALTSFAMTAIFICLLVSQKIDARVAVTIAVSVAAVLVCKLLALGGVAVFIGALAGVVAGTAFGLVRKPC